MCTCATLASVRFVVCRSSVADEILLERRQIEAHWASEDGIEVSNGIACTWRRRSSRAVSSVAARRARVADAGEIRLDVDRWRHVLSQILPVPAGTCVSGAERRSFVEAVRRLT